MRINYYVVGPLQENCYIVSGYNGAGEKDCVVIDPGDEGQTLVKGIKEAGLVPLLILLTHGHSDHTGGLSELHAEWPLAEIAMEQEDLYMLKRSEQGLPLPSRLLSDKETIGPFVVFKLPGHSQGSVAYYSEADKTLFSGDTLFRGSIGRTDFKGGDEQSMIKSLACLSKLPDDTIVYPGHGPSTTIGFERNFYLS